MNLISSPTREQVLSVVLSLICGILLEGKSNLCHWGHEIDRYRAGTESGALIAAVFETIYLLSRIIGGGYGSYVVFRELIAPIFRQPASQQAKAKIE
jgi:hypothetical protein